MELRTEGEEMRRGHEGERERGEMRRCYGDEEGGEEMRSGLCSFQSIRNWEDRADTTCFGV